MPKVRILRGDAIRMLSRLDDDSVQCVVTSPPYWGLRDYKHPKQVGSESSPYEYIDRLVSIFREVRRVLRPDGTLWLNLGDCYATGAGKVGSHPGGGAQGKGWKKRGHSTQPNRLPIEGLKPKDLIGLPWRVALALQADGWYLRSDIIWNKPNPMPESITDRPTKAHEYLFLFAKSRRYFYDHYAIKEDGSNRSMGNKSHKYTGTGDKKHRTKECLLSVTDKVWKKRNRRTVWTIATKPYPEAHFAVFPDELPRVCVQAGTSERGCCSLCGSPYKRIIKKTKKKRDDFKGSTFDKGKTGAKERGGDRTQKGDCFHSEPVGWKQQCSCKRAKPVPCTVLDPFGGSGTTAKVAKELGRHSVLVELNKDYVALIKKRLRK